MLSARGLAVSAARRHSWRGYTQRSGAAMPAWTATAAGSVPSWRGDRGDRCTIRAKNGSAARHRRFSSSGEQTVTGVVLTRRPQLGEAVSDAHMHTTTLPAEPLTPGTVRCRTALLSVDPFLRCRFNEDTGVDYTAPYEVGGLISSAGIGVVEEVPEGDGESGGLRVGDVVLEPFDSWPWADRAVLPARALTVIPSAVPLLFPVSALLGAVGQTGLTAFCGVTHEVSLGSGDVLAVSGAAGAVGHMVGQLAAQRGAKVIGIVGSEEKSRVLTERCGFTAAVSRHGGVAAIEAALRDALNTAGANEFTHYFDNTGGEVTDAVVRTMGEGSRIILCGQIATYNDDVEYPPPLPVPTATLAKQRSITRERYLVLNHREHFGTALAALAAMVAGDELAVLETITGDRGVAGAPAAFISMMEGGNVGKALVNVSDLPPAFRGGAWLREHVLPAALRKLAAQRAITAETFAFPDV